MSSADEIIIDDGALRVVCLPLHGFVISEFHPSGVGNLLWSRQAASRLPDLPVQATSVADSDDFDDAVFIGGWFGMFPTAGLPGETDDDRIMHGDLPRVRWQVQDHDRSTVTATAEARPGFGMTRRLSVSGGVLVVETEIRNRTDHVQLVAYGEHPCLSRTAFRGGRVVVDAGIVRIPVAVTEPGAASLLPGSEGSWPWVSGIDGAARDASRIPAVADGTHDHVALSLDSGTFAVEAPSLKGRLVFSVDPETLPHVLIWRHFHPPASPWGADVFSPEAMSHPGRSLDDPGARAALRSLESGGSLRWRARAAWQPLGPLAVDDQSSGTFGDMT